MNASAIVRRVDVSKYMSYRRSMNDGHTVATVAVGWKRGEAEDGSCTANYGTFCTARSRRNAYFIVKLFLTRAPCVTTHALARTLTIFRFQRAQYKSFHIIIS